MSDLSDRLRDIATHTPAGEGPFAHEIDADIAAIAEAADELDRRSARAAELEAVLREVEWRGTAVLDDMTRLYTCLFCGNLKVAGHKPNCRLAKLLPE